MPYINDPCDEWPIPAECFLEKARSVGFEGETLPWFGVFVEMENLILIITNYPSKESVNIALEEMSGTGKTGSVLIYGQDKTCAGFVSL